MLALLRLPTVARQAAAGAAAAGVRRLAAAAAMPASHASLARHFDDSAAASAGLAAFALARGALAAFEDRASAWAVHVADLPSPSTSHPTPSPLDRALGALFPPPIIVGDVEDSAAPERTSDELAEGTQLLQPSLPEGVEEAVLNMSSVVKKRRKKMRKHKHRKLRRRMRNKTK
eukprot:tig00022075_g23590.t1